MSDITLDAAFPIHAFYQTSVVQVFGCRNKIRNVHGIEAGTQLIQMRGCVCVARVALSDLQVSRLIVFHARFFHIAHQCFATVNRTARQSLATSKYGNGWQH
jgi:hypothetical protein